MPRKLLVTAVLLTTILLQLASAADAQAVWQYAFTDINTGEATQSTANAVRWWPSPGYTTSSSYYRLGSSLSATWKTRARDSAQTWSNVDALFHFYELPLGSDPYDHTLGLVDWLPPAALGATYRGFTRDASNRPTFSYWYIRFNSTKDWVDGNVAGFYDIKSTETHEFGHVVRLIDLYEYDPAWTDTTIPTMWYYLSDGSIGKRTLSPGDTNGVHTLY